MARRLGNLEAAAAEAGGGAVAIECDVTEPKSCYAAMDEAAKVLGGIDAVVYTPAIGPLRRLVETDADTWRLVFDTNVTGAALITAAALPYLEESAGTAIYLSSVSASQTAPWPGLGAYAVSKAALDKMVEAWRAEHPHVGFTRLVVGDCAGGEGDGMTQFAQTWDPDLAGELVTSWIDRGLIAGAFIDVDHLASVVDGLVRNGSSITVPSVTVTPRAAAPLPAPVPVAD